MGCKKRMRITDILKEVYIWFDVTHLTCYFKLRISNEEHFTTPFIIYFFIK